ncbi:hypothetical protein ACPJHQ_19440 [Rossellomorea sp. H39__3]
MLGSLWTLSGTSGSAAKGDDAIFGYVPLSGDWKQGKKGNVDGEARKKAPALMVSADKKGDMQSMKQRSPRTNRPRSSSVQMNGEKGSGDPVQREER